MKALGHGGGQDKAGTRFRKRGNKNPTEVDVRTYLTTGFPLKRMYTPASLLL